MNQIGGMLGEQWYDDMLDMAGIEEDAAKIKETIGTHRQLDNITNTKVQQEKVDPHLSLAASNYINQKQVTTQKYNFKVFSTENKDVKLHYNSSNLKEILTHSTTPYITVSTYYRVKALESQITRLGGLNVMTFVKVVARIVDNVSDGCGGAGNNCLFLEEGVNFFNIMTNFLISNGYNPVGSLTMANEMMKQSYYNPSPLAEPAKLDLDRGLTPATEGKPRKSSKKKNGSKKKPHIKTNERK